MLHDDAEKQEYFLWRLMIDREHQGEGFGRRTIDLVVDYVRQRPGARVLVSSLRRGDTRADGFYRSCGFVETGEVENGEVLIQLKLKRFDEESSP